MSQPAEDAPPSRDIGGVASWARTGATPPAADNYQPYRRTVAGQPPEEDS